jgi:ABC-type dipeptide/oligopeptide/nickel transport system ATPase subunit
MVANLSKTFTQALLILEAMKARRTYENNLNICINHTIVCIENMPNRLRVINSNQSANVVRAQYILDSVEKEDVLPLEPK